MLIDLQFNCLRSFVNGLYQNKGGERGEVNDKRNKNRTVIDLKVIYSLFWDFQMISIKVLMRYIRYEAIFNFLDLNPLLRKILAKRW